MSDHYTPIDILHLRFSRRFRGYATAEVDAFLRDVAADLEMALTAGAEAREKIASLERELKQYRTLESTMRDALVLAQRAADETRTASRAQADACMQEAQLRSREIEAGTHEKLADIQSRISLARQEHRHVINVLRSRLTAQLAWLGDEEADLLQTAAGAALDRSPEAETEPLQLSDSEGEAVVEAGLTDE